MRSRWQPRGPALPTERHPIVEAPRSKANGATRFHARAGPVACRRHGASSADVPATSQPPMGRNPPCRRGKPPCFEAGRAQSADERHHHRDRRVPRTRHFPRPRYGRRLRPRDRFPVPGKSRFPDASLHGVARDANPAMGSWIGCFPDRRPHTRDASVVKSDRSPRCRRCRSPSTRRPSWPKGDGRWAMGDGVPRRRPCGCLPGSRGPDRGPRRSRFRNRLDRIRGRSTEPQKPRSPEHLAAFRAIPGKGNSALCTREVDSGRQKCRRKNAGPEKSFRRLEGPLPRSAAFDSRGVPPPR